MKRLIGCCLLLLWSAAHLHADEGMWFLKLMEQQHLADSLRKAGLQIPPEALYSETGPSLREVVGIFGSGCTGEVVSADGLILTNNHCGFTYVNDMSTLEANYLRDGYFARSRAEELPVPDLDFTFVVRIDDVTAEVERAARDKGADAYTAQSQAFLEPLAESLLEKSDLRKRKGMRARIVPFFDGNSFYLFLEQTYTDVRLVANPPLNVAQFGGNQDNWVWPRHSADFAMFRIYADKHGQPAPYAASNRPLRCPKFLPVSLRGTERGDYTMIMGFPGTTSRYLTASGIESRVRAVNEPTVLAGTEQLAFFKQEMDADPAVRIALENDNMMRGNVVKNFGGMNLAVQRERLVEQRRRQEAEFRRWVRSRGLAEYEGVIERIDSLEASVADTLHDATLLQATLGQQRFYIRPQVLFEYIHALHMPDGAQRQEARRQLLDAYDRSIATARLDVDRRMMRRLIPLWQKNARLKEARALIPSEGREPDAYLDALYNRSAFRDKDTLAAFLDRADLALFMADPLVAHWVSYLSFVKGKIGPAVYRYTTEQAALSRLYTRGLCEMNGWTKAPDANFTLRMTYGHTCDLRPRDAVHYDWRTTLEGLFEKENPRDSDYVVNERLRRLYDARDFGPYAREDGQLPLCFLSDNDITGGNSGSPVLNARGELVGLAFDGNIESLSSDLQFNPRRQRCINLDIRYVLFILDKFGGSSYVLREMDVRR